MANQLLACVLAIAACSALPALSAPMANELLPYEPVADPKAIVPNTGPQARFTVLTGRLIRMEYARSAIEPAFEDRATPAFVNRKLPVPAFQSSVVNGILTVQTAYLTLKYTVGQPFSAATLSATGIAGSGKNWTWSFGMANAGNLPGTIKSLDELNVVSLNCSQNADIVVHDESLHCQWGLISRLGWTVVDDSDNWGLSATDWWDSPNVDAQDLYLFGHGWDYVGALGDYTLVGGKIAMVPRSASGIMWSVWLNLDNQGVRDIVDDYQSRDIPLDTYILDMDWHTKQGWGGYSFDNRLFPLPQATMFWLKDQGLTTLCNLHDDDGVRSSENEYGAMCAAIGDNFNQCAAKQTVPFDICGANSEAYMLALEDIVLGAVDKQGMDYYWIDWQQGGTQGGCAGGKQNPTIWLNKVRGTDHLRRKEPTRDMVLARWGGLGNHRYQVGFSGDVAQLTWQNLAFQPYFSLTSSNVAYGYWSHDIVGPADDHELHTRWIQWGAFSGVFRTHDRGMSAGSCANDNPSSCGIVKIWDLPTKYFKACRSAMTMRQALVPYIYTAQREAFDTGVSLLRPMYYSWPDLDQAYAADSAGDFAQYMFGPDILAAPVVNMAAAATSMASKSIWLPPPASGSSQWAWFQENSGKLFSTSEVGAAGMILHSSFDLSEVPLFVRAGAVIPRLPLVSGGTIGAASRQYAALEFEIYPGATSGQTKVYEDDAETTAYLSGAFAWTTASYTRSSTTMQVKIQTSGSFASLPSNRAYTIRVRNYLPLQSASVSYLHTDGRQIANERIRFSSMPGTVSSWLYDGNSMSTVITLASAVTSSPITVQLETIAPVDDSLMSGIAGALRHAQLAKRNFDDTRVTPGAQSVSGGQLSITASTADHLSYVAGGSGKDLKSFMQLLSGFRNQFQLGLSEVLSMGPTPPPFAPGSFQQLWSSQRGDNCVCGTADCVSTNPNYLPLRIEGYQPTSGELYSVPFYDFWSESAEDNLGTPGATPSGYSPAIFKNGYILARSKPGTTAMQLWYSSDRQDYLSVASTAGIAYAKNNGYSVVNTTIGYVYTQPQMASKAVVGAINYDRWAHSVELLQTASQ